MTIDEAIKHAEEVAENKENEYRLEEKLYGLDSVQYLECANEHRQLAEWLKDYKRLLEQEPCDDCISRDKAIVQLSHLLSAWNYDWNVAIRKCIETVKIVPPVTPQPKIGRWIADAQTYYEELNKRGLGVDEYTPYFTDDIACSECLAKYSVIDNETQFFKHCPNCGAKMKDGD